MSDEQKVTYSDKEKLAIELARSREILRRLLPDLAHQAYGEAQQSPYKVGDYIKAALKEANKKGLIRAPSPSEDP